MILYETFESLKQFQGEEVFKNKLLEKPCIIENLNQAMTLRPYQREAIGRYLFYQESFVSRRNPTHLLFNMATGSGKTLIMAATMLHLYEQGYRNFVFFTRLGNIVEKTKSNFLNKKSSKYLFAEQIMIGGKPVTVTEVKSFEDASEDDINIYFATTALLHSRFNSALEDSITFEDFSDKKVVLIADEAHNLSAETTSKPNQADKEDRKNWENTVLSILNADVSDRNILLEFTATARLEVEYPEVLAKYEDKAIYRYGLKEFRVDGFSKEVRTLQIDAPLLERVLAALVISQYRRKVAEKYNIQIKPVVLFKSNRVTEPAAGAPLVDKPEIVVSALFKAAFHNLIEMLTEQDLISVSKIYNPTLGLAFKFFEEHGISLPDLVSELKIDFSKEKCLTVDDDKDVEEKQVLLNSLEEADNQIRAIFATEKLNEGWDVLNLFDIVRLYNTRDSKSNRAGKSTVQEAQLIGRGARYFPFSTSEEQSRFQRKFDSNAEHELRILEVLHYHSATNSRYIQELESVLVRDGIISSRNVEREIRIKDEFKHSDIWKSGVVYLNKRLEVGPESTGAATTTIQFNTQDPSNIFLLQNRGSIEKDVFSPSDSHHSNDSKNLTTIDLKELGSHVLREALARNPRGGLSSLKAQYPNLESLQAFIENHLYLGSLKIQISGSEERIRSLNQKEKLAIAAFVVGKVLDADSPETKLYTGTREFIPYRISEIFKEDKVIQLDGDSPRAQAMKDLELSNSPWFAQTEIWGTSEEEGFLRFIDRSIAELSTRYSSIVLLRNEQYFALFNFSDGQPFYPDFLLILQEKKTGKDSVRQIFIEPKGDQFLDANNRFELSKEGWKQRFLKEIEAEASLTVEFEDESYVLLGMPFYNEGSKNKELHSEFTEAFDRDLLL
jgi:type III restriction enzyme